MQNANDIHSLYNLLLATWSQSYRAVWAFSAHQTHCNERKVCTTSALGCAPIARTVGEYNSTSRLYDLPERLRARVRDRQQTRNQCNPSNILVDVVDAVFHRTPEWLVSVPARCVISHFVYLNSTVFSIILGHVLTTGVITIPVVKTRLDTKYSSYMLLELYLVWYTVARFTDVIEVTTDTAPNASNTDNERM